MFSKAESRQLREHFWLSFGKSYPTKWTLYRTKVKGLAFKFSFTQKEAVVSMDMDGNLADRISLWEKTLSLKSVLLACLPDLVFEGSYRLDNGKEISRVYVILKDVNIHNKATWQKTMVFLDGNMRKFEKFFDDFNTVFRS